MPKDERKNNLPPRKDVTAPVNALASLVGHPSGTAEYIKGYAHQFGFDPTDFTEKKLSPEGREALRQMAAMNFGKTADKWGDIHTDYPTTGSTPGALENVLGRVAPSNIRKVIIDGVPYWQVLDRYDFNNAQERIANGESSEMWGEIANDLMRGRVSFDTQRKLPSLLDLGYNMNLLVPVNPGQEAHPESVEMFRQKNRLPFPNKTLGNKVVNTLSPKYTEKAMP